MPAFEIARIFGSAPVALYDLFNNFRAAFPAAALKSDITQ